MRIAMVVHACFSLLVSTAFNRLGMKFRGAPSVSALLEGVRRAGSNVVVSDLPLAVRLLSESSNQCSYDERQVRKLAHGRC